jgi:hypothetical protein
VLGLRFISAQELNQVRGELFCGATKALPWEQRTKSRVLANTRVELRRQPPAAVFATERTQEFRIHRQKDSTLHGTPAGTSIPAALPREAA